MTKDDIAQLMNETAGSHWGTEEHFHRFAYILLNQKNDYKYMVSVTGSQAPNHIHKSFEEAKKEALRLSGIPNNRDRTIHVVSIEATLRPHTEHRWD